MPDPALAVRLTVQGSALDEYVARIKIDVADSSGLMRLRMRDADRSKKWGRDQVHVLARVGEEAHHGEGDEGAHGAAVVVAREAAVCGIEGAGDVAVDAMRGEARSSCVVVLENC